MEYALTALKVTTAIAGVIGYVMYSMLLAPEIQDELIYSDRNPLFADIVKYTLYAVNFCLVVCALCPWWKLSATPMWAWASVGFAGIAYILYSLESGKFYRKSGLIQLLIRACIAGLITFLTHQALIAANA